MVYSKNLNDATLDRSYEYNSLGRLVVAHAGAEARAHVGLGQWGTMDGPFSLGYEYDVWGNLTHQYGWGGETQGGTAGQTSDIYRTYANNRIVGATYDASGNLTSDVGQTFTYDATGQQATATLGAYFLQQFYDGNGLRVKKNDNGVITYYLRSSVLGGQVAAEITWNGVSWQWNRGYVYLGSQLLAVQQSGSVSWMHQDPVNKSKRVTNSAGTVVSTVELDPWGADTNRSNNAAFQPRKFTSYERDGNGSDEAMFRRYNRKLSRFDQPDPYDGSSDLTNPQSFNRYAYVQNDPVNFVDPSGLVPSDGQCQGAECPWSGGGGGFWGGGWNFNDRGHPGRESIGGRSFTSSVYEPESGRIRFWTWAPFPELLGQVIANTWSGLRPQNTSVEVSLPDVDAGISSLLSNPNCATFVTNLIKATAAETQNPAHSANGLTVYGMIRGIVFEQQFSDGIAVSGSVGGRISTHNATINISPSSVSSFAGASLHREVQLRYLITALHETIHQAGKNGWYSDAQLAKAAHDLMSPERRAASRLPDPRDASANSRFWGDELKSHCNPTGR